MKLALTTVTIWILNTWNLNIQLTGHFFVWISNGLIMRLGRHLQNRTFYNIKQTSLSGFQTTIPNLDPLPTWHIWTIQIPGLSGIQMVSVVLLKKILVTWLFCPWQGFEVTLLSATLLKLIVLGLRRPRPLAEDLFLEISRTSEKRKRLSSYPFPHNSSEPPSSITSNLLMKLKNKMCSEDLSNETFM